MLLCRNKGKKKKDSKSRGFQTATKSSKDLIEVKRKKINLLNNETLNCSSCYNFLFLTHIFNTETESSILELLLQRDPRKYKKLILI